MVRVANLCKRAFYFLGRAIVTYSTVQIRDAKFPEYRVTHFAIFMDVGIF